MPHHPPPRIKEGAGNPTHGRAQGTMPTSIQSLCPESAAVLPIDPQALPAGLTAPATTTDGATFTALLTQAGAPATPVVPPGIFPPAPAPLLHPLNPKTCAAPAVIMTEAPPAICAAPRFVLPSPASPPAPDIAETDAAVETPLRDETEDPVARALADGAPLIEFQFVAGQWIPTPPPAPPADLTATPDTGEISADTAPLRADCFSPAAPAGAPLASASPRAPAAPTTANFTPAATPASSPSPAAPAETSAPAASAALPLPTAAPVPTAPTVQLPAPETPLAAPTTTGTLPPSSRLAEKFAGHPRLSKTDGRSGVNPPAEYTEKTSLNADVKQLVREASSVGTPAANRENTMSDVAPSKPSPADPLPVADFARLTAKGGPHGDSPTAPAPVESLKHAGAAQLVREIRDIGERVSSLERNSVEVRFDFSEHDRLSVRVEYRDGTVHTTFRTDSPELRDTLTREWTALAPAAEQRAYRVAEPTFKTEPTDHSGRTADYSGDHTGGQRHTGEQSPRDPGFAPSSRSPRAAAAPRAPAAHATETNRHLHALA